MPLYAVPVTGTGAADDPIRPNLPRSTTWTGVHVPQVPCFAVWTNAVLSGPGIRDIPLDRLDAAVESRKLRPALANAVEAIFVPWLAAIRATNLFPERIT